MIDASALEMVLVVLTGWLARQERRSLAYLVEENRVLRHHLRGQRLQLTDDDRRLAVLAHRLGRRVLRQIATVVTPDTILRWHRQLIARKWTYARKGSSRHLRVFGSIARGDDRATSDVDLLVDMEPGRTLLDVIALEQDFAAVLGRPVEVFTEGGLSPYLQQRILAEALAL